MLISTVSSLMPPETFTVRETHRDESPAARESVHRMTAMSVRVTEPAAAELEQHRRELTAYAYRMLGSPFEAEDAVQEAFIRAWRSLDKFEGRAALKSWLYKITTNVCLDLLSA